MKTLMKSVEFSVGSSSKRKSVSLLLIKLVIPTNARREAMLHYAVVFLIIALIAGALGFFGIAGTAAWIAKVLFVVFLVLFVVSLISGRKPAA